MDRTRVVSTSVAARRRLPASPRWLDGAGAPMGRQERLPSGVCANDDPIFCGRRNMVSHRKALPLR